MPDISEDAKVVEHLNTLISQRTSYGRRTEIASKASHVLVWSNASSDWYVLFYTVKRGESVSLDANELLVPYGKAQIRRIIPLLMPLPLASYSFESRTKRQEQWEGVPPEWVQEIVTDLRKIPGNLPYHERLKIFMSFPGSVPPPVAASITQALIQDPSFARLADLVEELVFSYPQVATMAMRVRDAYYEEE